MREIGTNRTSGASLAIVGFAVVGTAAYGALSKQREAHESHSVLNPKGAYNFELRLVDEGIGIAPVPTAPPAARWLKFELFANGQPVHHRPVQFRKTAKDAQGRPLLVEHRWSSGYFYTFVRSGYRKTEGPVALDISFRDRLVKAVTLAPLPPAKRAIQPVRTVPRWPGLTAEVVRTPNEEERPLALRVNAPLRKDEALVIRPVGSSFEANEPYGDPTFAKAGPLGMPRVVPLPIGYPRDADAVSVKAMRFRARPVRKVLEFGIRYRGGSESDYHFALGPNSTNLIDGLSLSLSRFDRSISLPRDGSRPLSIFVTGRQVVGRSWVRLISPRKINNLDVRLGNRLSAAEGVAASLPPSPNAPTAHIRVPEQTIPVKIEVEIWQYEPVYEETLVIPFKFDAVPIESKWNRYPLRYFG
jgi:hypothetical protein